MEQCAQLLRCQAILTRRRKVQNSASCIMHVRSNQSRWVVGGMPMLVLRRQHDHVLRRLQPTQVSLGYREE